MSISAGWITLTERAKKPFFYYRKTELYQMAWGANFNLADYAIAAAPYGGPIAMYKKITANSVGAEAGDKSNDKMGGESSEAQLIQVYSSSGFMISQFEWKGKGKEGRGLIENLSWTDELKLVLLTRGGQIAVYDVHGAALFMEERNTQLNLDKNEYVLKSKFSGKTAAIYTTDCNLFFAEDLSKLTGVTSVEEREDAEKQKKRDDKDNTPKENAVFKRWEDVQKISALNSIEIIPIEHACESDMPTSEVVLCPAEDGEDEYSIYVATPTKTYKISMADFGEVRHSQLSPDGKVIACYCMGTKDHPAGLYVFNLDFKSYFLELLIKKSQQNQNEDYIPEQLVFCGDKTVAVVWGPNALQEDISMILIANIYGDTKSFVYEGSIHVAQEVDCSRIITNYSCEILERVHDAAVDVFRVGSLKTGALLYDAYNDYVKSKPTAIKTIREIKNKAPKDSYSSSKKKHPLIKAIKQCLKTASREFDTDIQLQLVKAAAFGKNFTHDVDTDDSITKTYFVTRLQDLRILNEVRKVRYGIPITYEQYKHLGIRSLIGRLVEMHYHKLAFKICKFLKLPQDQINIVLHWASTKVIKIEKYEKLQNHQQQQQQQHEDEDEDEDFPIDPSIKNNEELKKKPEEMTYTIIQEVVEALALRREQISFADVAQTAYKVGRKKLAKNLLQDDKKPQDQIPLYLSMHETHSAIERAIESNNSDLMCLVIIYLFHVLSNDLKYMFELVSDRPEMERLFITYCKMIDLNRLQEFYSWKREFRNTGLTQLSDAYKHFRPDTIEKHKELLASAMATFEQAGYDATLDNKMAEYQSRILNIQPRLEKYVEEKGKRVKMVGKTLHDTIYSCIINGLIDKAELIRQKFDVSDKRYWTISVKAMAQMKMWDAMFELAMSSPPPTNSVLAFFRGSSNDGPYSPIGFEPFVDACLNANEDKLKKEAEALKYIPFVKDPSMKVDYYIRLQKFKEAIEVAAEIGDADLLEVIRTKTKNTKTRETIDNLINQIRSAK